jgi:hypothetical protein
MLQIRGYSNIVVKKHPVNAEIDKAFPKMLFSDANWLRMIAAWYECTDLNSLKTAVIYLSPKDKVQYSIHKKLRENIEEKYERVIFIAADKAVPRKIKDLLI